MLTSVRLAPSLALLCCAVLCSGVASCQQSVAPQPAVQEHATGATPQTQAVRRTGEIVVDGRLDEPFWQTVPAASGFRQRDPHEGQPSSQRTELHFAYDDEALYIGARMY